MTEHPCPRIANPVNIELRSKDGLKAYMDNYMLSGRGQRIARSLATKLSTVWEARPDTTTFGVRYYRDTYRTCSECGRHIFEEE